MLAISSTHNSQPFTQKFTGKAVENFHFRQLLCARQKSLVFGEAGKKPKAHKIELRAFFLLFFPWFQLFQHKLLSRGYIDVFTTHKYVGGKWGYEQTS